MKPSAIDLQFWSCIHLPERLPRWAVRFAAQRMTAADYLHAAINLRGNIARSRFAMEAGNACGVLRMIRKRHENLRAHMAWACVEYALVQPTRAATYRRWLQRMSRRNA